jgi:hypothetical protein
VIYSNDYKKGGSAMMKMLLLWIVAIVMVSGCTSSSIADNSGLNINAGKTCSAICGSHGFETLKERNAIYENPVCYCADNESRIWTFVM